MTEGNERKTYIKGKFILPNEFFSCYFHILLYKDEKMKTCVLCNKIDIEQIFILFFSQ